MSALMPLNCWNTNSMQPMSTPLRSPGLNMSAQVLASLEAPAPEAAGRACERVPYTKFECVHVYVCVRVQGCVAMKAPRPNASTHGRGWGKGRVFRVTRATRAHEQPHH